MDRSRRHEHSGDVGVAFVASGEIGFDEDGVVAWLWVWVYKRLWR